MTNADAINPKHYRGLEIDGHQIQCIDMIEVLDLGFHLGNALKYAWRFGRKGAVKHIEPRSASIMSDGGLSVMYSAQAIMSTTQLLEDADKCEWYLARWRAQGYEHRVGFHANACLDANAKRQLELSGHLRQMINFAREYVQRSQDFHTAVQASGHVVSAEQSFDPIPYMRELVELLDIRDELIKHVA